MFSLFEFIKNALNRLLPINGLCNDIKGSPIDNYFSVNGLLDNLEPVKILICDQVSRN